MAKSKLAKANEKIALSNKKYQERSSFMDEELQRNIFVNQSFRYFM